MRIVPALHCLVLKYSWLIIYYMILSLFVSYGLLLGSALFRFCSVFVPCAALFLQFSDEVKANVLFAALGKW